MDADRSLLLSQNRHRHMYGEGDAGGIPKVEEHSDSGSGYESDRSKQSSCDSSVVSGSDSDSTFNFTSDEDKESMISYSCT